VKEENRSAAGSLVSETAKSLLIQMISNLFQGKRSTSTRKEIPATGYRTTHCDKCLWGSFESVFNPILVEGVTKLIHNCKNENLLDGQNKEDILRIKNEGKAQLENQLSKAVISRIGQRAACLKAVKLSRQAFSEEVRKKLKVPVNRSLIEERDSIKINLPCDRDSADHFWFCRAIREVGKNNGIIKINQKELVEFLRIAKSTFGVFTDIVRKDYFLIYLEL
jgi:hypothetical protein